MSVSRTWKRKSINGILATLGTLAALMAGCAHNKTPAAPPTEIVQPAQATAISDEKAFADGFEAQPTLASAWAPTGDVAIDTAEAFEGRQSLRLTRGEAEALRPVNAVGPAFKVEPGNYQISLAARSDLTSPDNSFKGEVSLEYLSAEGQPRDRVSVAELDKRQNWKEIKKNISVPDGVASARFRVNLDKALGRFWVDAIAITPSTVSNDDPVVDRIFFDTAQMGNLLFPTDSRRVKVTAWTRRELSERERSIQCIVTDYWGVEQAEPIPAKLSKTGVARNTLHVYEGTFDLAPIPLEIGRYYEFRATLTKDPQGNAPGGTFGNYSSFAILPFAPANRHRPEDVPFTSRTWDARIDTAQYLNYRLGIRIGGIWGGWSKEPPHEPYGATIEVIEKHGMGFLTGSPAHDVEQRKPGHERWTDEALRAGVRAFIAKYGHIRPMVINLGNEPPNKGDDVKLNVEAYKSIYEEVKKIDPSIIVVGTSVGPSEDFFKAGFGKYLDAYDFHIYGDSGEVREAIEKLYPAMFAKYGNAKPIWSTELGFSSHGMARIEVVREMVRKTSNFFAAGGANMSWFGIMYPDPDAKIVGTGGESHNVFDCRYMKYAPKLDAISYYNMVNGIAVKKFKDERIYESPAGGIKAFLFRDGDGDTLQVLYMDKGREDVMVPLDGVQDVEVIRVDGTRSTLWAGNKGLTLTVGEDPLLLLYKSQQDELPAALLAPAAKITARPGNIVCGDSGKLSVAPTDGVKAALKLPFRWTAAAEVGDPATQSFTLTSPKDTAAREADLVIRLADASGRPIGELYDRPSITGDITMSLLPSPAAGDGMPGVKLVVRNNGRDTQQISWNVVLQSAKPVINGAYPDKPITADAYFAAPANGELAIPGNSGQEIVLPLAKVDAHTVYYVKAIVADSSGRQVVSERPVAGFVSVPKVKPGAIKIDGDLSDAAWSKATVARINRIDEYYNFRRPNREAEWTGPADLSAEIRYLWDEQYLYVGVTVVDDIAGKPQADGMIWSQDGLQFLFDPTRTSVQKAGRYDYAVALSSKGLQAWSYLTADTALAPSGEVKDMKLGIRRTDPANGNMTYEVAIPWSRLSPFKPAVGANLGATLIVNEDDGNGRDSFLTWFGNAHSKDIETVGDLILAEESK